VPRTLDLEPDTIFASDYRIVRPLNEGGMGAVYLVEQISTGSLRALKVMHEHLVQDDKLRARFVQEARVCSRIRSDHVVQVIGAGIDEPTGTPWLVMELLEGRDLAAHVRAKGPLSIDEVREICAQLCHALAAAHQVGIVHRDLKPENIFLSEARREGAFFTLKVLDFGIAKILSEAIPSTTTTAIGTPLWMAPEQTDIGATIGPSTDVWALGLIVFWMLTGHFYWRAATHDQPSAMALMREVVFEPLVPACTRVEQLHCGSTLPLGFESWFSRCIVRDTSQRFQDAGQARAALLPILGDPSVGPATSVDFHVSTDGKNPAATVVVSAELSGSVMADDVVTAPTQLAAPTPVRLPDTLPTAPAVTESVPPPSLLVQPGPRPWPKWAMGAGLVLAMLAVMLVARSKKKPAAINLQAECARGSHVACAALARGYEHGGRGLSRNMEQAASHYLRACEHGDIQSCVEAGNLYRSGENVPRDEAKAASAYDKACTGGEGIACRNLAWMTLNGDGVAKSDARAVWLLLQACNRGQPEACTKAGEMHREGRGVAADPEQAKELLTRGCVGRDPKACKELDRLDRK
jgi:serine/threonine protein kinase/TPR repeat protein